MLKKSLLIGFLCIGLMALLVPQASAGCCCNPRFCATWLKGDVQCNLSVLSNVPGAWAECRVYGTGGSGELTGTAFCAPTDTDMAVLASNMEECRLKGKGHIKQIGKGHAKHGDCKTLPGQVIYTGFTPFSANGSFDESCDTPQCQASFTIQTRPDINPCGDGYILVDFVPDAFYGQAEWGGYEGYGGDGGDGGTITELCRATGGLYYNCEPADPGDIPRDE
jgi:hypothetical protein